VRFAGLQLKAPAIYCEMRDLMIAKKTAPPLKGRRSLSLSKKVAERRPFCYNRARGRRCRKWKRGIKITDVK
jgi:hypothetical protein